ncbi:MAG: phosphatidylserine/phosphatidylglycerophosphate/cardiolipin synthase family protein [Pseudobdellovibrionaceae bacterium]
MKKFYFAYIAPSLSTLLTVVLTLILGVSAQANSTKSLVEQSFVHNVKKENARAFLRLCDLGNAGAAKQYGHNFLDNSNCGPAEETFNSENAAIKQIDSLLKNQPLDADVNKLFLNQSATIYPASLNPQIWAGTQLPTIETKAKTENKNKPTLFTPILPQAIGLYNPDGALDAKSLLFNIGERFVSTVSGVDELNFLMIPEDALARKIELLTGSKLPPEVIQNQILNYPIDFSRAPRLTEILVSTLFLRADFTGTMFARTLIYHAKQGTKVRIMMSEAALRGLHLSDSENKKKDYALFNELEKTPNIEVQKLAYKFPDYTPTLVINEIHRAHHAKLVVMIGDNPKDSRVIVGGRNLSDAYSFQTPPNNSRFPFLIQYKATGYMPVEDMELDVRSAELAQNARAQFLVFWNREETSQEFDLPFYHIPAAAIADAKSKKLMENKNATYIRHFWHAPFKNEKEAKLDVDKNSQLEALFVTMVNSAQRTIQIVTPYFNLPDRLAAALRRAAQRNVKVTVITNASLMGDDFIPGAVTAANKMGMRKMLDSVQFFTWDNPKVMLHAKMMLIDSQFLYVGSTNMNKRSFNHDVENGLLISGPKAVQGFQNALNRYKPVIRPLSSAEITASAGAFNETLVKTFEDMF